MDDSSEPISWAGRYHANAMNHLFGRSYENDEAFYEDFERRLDASFIQAKSSEDPDQLLEYALANCLFDDSSGARVELAQKAVEIAQNSNLPLGRFKYGLAQVSETEQLWEEAIAGYSESLSLGFGHAALNLGLLYFDENAFSNAIRTWIRGRDEFGDSDCAAQLKQVETSPGVYEAEIELEDGSVDIVVYTENSGGFGGVSNS